MSGGSKDGHSSGRKHASYIKGLLISFQNGLRKGLIKLMGSQIVED